MKKVITATFIIALIFPAFSQKYGEVGFFAGSSLYGGDVYSSISTDSHFSYGVNYKRNFNSRWSLNTLFRYAYLTGNDKNSESNFEKQRNLHFQSNLYELGSVMEFNFLDFKPFKPQSFFQIADVFTPYVFIGLSIFYHNPKAYLAGNLYELRILQTEGVEYAKVGLAIPIGIGFKFRLTDRLLLSTTLEYHHSLTDYLDDVSSRYPTDPDALTKTGRDLSNRAIEPQGPNGSNWGTQRGNVFDDDWFSYLGLTLSYNLKKNPSTCHFNPSK